MKKIFVMIAAIGLLYSCGGNTQKNKEVEETVSVSEFSEIAENVPDGHNAKSSLDYKGTYTGKIPSASGEGIIVTITVDDSTYVKKNEYVNKKDATFEEKGKYTWNDEGNTIILEGVKDAPNKYFVGEGTLTQLDMDGNKITGETADLYILKK